MKKLNGVLLVVILSVSIPAIAQKNKFRLRDEIAPAVFSISRVMMHDVISPPAASRYYAYTMMGAYEIVAQNDASITPLSAFVHDYEQLSIAEKQGQYNPEIASVYCILETGKRLLPSGFMLQEDEEKFIATLKKKKIAQTEIDQSVAVAEEVAAALVNWTKGDHYGKLSTLLQYTPVKGEGYWYPTPPAYMAAIEPNWKTLRTLVIDSCNQFIPAAPKEFSKDSSSTFYHLAYEVYKTGNELNAEQRLVASFWDCNPFVVSTSGHMAIGFKKITPGGHWMSIAGIASKKANLNFSQTIVTHTLTGITLMDAFISCWDEKYRSNRIRPETYINRYIDSKWLPILQTPPFPEYTSGHSVISTAAAEMLTYLLGDQFSFTDDSEMIFDIPERTFSSFRAAANEAAISRLYGGIHFRDAIEDGQTEGRALGKWMVNRIQQAGLKSFASN